jgi:hypothetical protein
MNDVNDSSIYKTHGWWMWTCYCLLGWVMIASKRYSMKYWLYGQLVHSACAAFITISTIVWAFKMFANMGWQI